MTRSVSYALGLSCVLLAARLAHPPAWPVAILLVGLLAAGLLAAWRGLDRSPPSLPFPAGGKRNREGA